MPPGILYVVLTGFQFPVTLTFEGLTIRLFGMLLVAVLAVITSQTFASTPPIRNGSGVIVLFQTPFAEWTQHEITGQMLSL